MEQNVVCRTCLRSTKKYVSVFSAPELWGKKIVLAKLIMACAPVIIKIGDGLPTKICDNCLQLLQLSFLFRLRIITANENYKEILRVQTSERNVATDKFHQMSNLNQIYSTEYIFESINDGIASSSRINDAIKQEPLDIKEEIVEKNSDSFTSQTDKKKLSSTPTKNQNNQTIKINNTKKCEVAQPKNNSNNLNININNNNSCDNSQTLNINKQLNKEFSFPFMENGFENCDVDNEEQIDNELNLKLINNQHRVKRTYSKLSNTKKSPSKYSVSKIPKLQDKTKVTLSINLDSDDESEIDSKPPTFCNKLLNNVESIVIDD